MLVVIIVKYIIVVSLIISIGIGPNVFSHRFHKIIQNFHLELRVFVTLVVIGIALRGRKIIRMKNN
jgi:hypothetical protein